VFTVVPGVEMRAGRDGSQCAILLAEPRISGVHASLRIDAGQLWLRDEHSNNGSQLNGTRLAPGTWTPVPNGSLIRFGPVEFSVSLE
jgi:pSer/pThr/pTyr-binding forkhead associated (FHA) protein